MHVIAVLPVEGPPGGLLVHERLGQAVARAKLHRAVLGMARVVDVQRLAQVVVLQVAAALGVQQDAAFATRGFGDQDAGAGQAGGVVLNELHVLQRHARAVGQGQAVAGFDGAVGCEREDAAEPAGADDDGVGAHDVQVARAQFQRDAALAAPVGREQAGGEELVVARDLAELQRGLEERVQDMKARLIRGVPGALDLHAAERPDRHVPGIFPAPGTAPVLQLNKFARGLVHEHLHGVLVGQPVGAADGVVDVMFAGVVSFDHSGHAPLGSHSVAAHGVDLGHQADGEVGVGFDDGHGGAQSGAAGPDDDDVVADFVHESDLREARRGPQLNGPAPPIR